jgi:nucleotide-binding universal stress UspA family protein
MEKILVPTDRSDESQKALAIAQQVASVQDAEIVLVHVYDPTAAALPASDGAFEPALLTELTEAIEDEARMELARLEEQVRARSGRVRSVMLQGTVSHTLLEFEAEERPDLVVMSTHGRTGLARFALGSVTDRLVREGTVPVLVTRLSSGVSAPLNRALVMLDGSGVAEEVLPVMRQLAGKPVQSVLLYRVVADPDDRGAAMSYLEGVASHFQGSGVAVSCTVDVGEPRHDIDRAAEDADLVVLCTHGRTGFDRLRHGSVADYVMRHVDKPALLVRAGAAHEAR